MAWLPCIARFCAGTFLVNPVPHVVSGVSERAFRTPFARPTGKGLSASTVNVPWGLFTLAVGDLLLLWVGAFEIGALDHAVTTAAGVILTALLLARCFGRFPSSNVPGKI